MELNATFLLQLFMFLVLLAWLSQVLFAPFLRLFEERERRIVGAAEDAKRWLGSADEKSALADARLKEAQGEARKVLNDLRLQGQARERELVDEARERAQERLEEARVELFAATDEARRALKDDAKKLASEIVVKVLGRAA